MTNVSCIGCGTVGSAWAVVFAKAGQTVSLFDQNEAGLTNLTTQTDYNWSDKTVKNIHNTLSEKIPVSEITHFQKIA